MQRLGLQPLRWPDPFPFDSEQALLAATYAKSIGRVVAFSLAAFRQAFAGGHALDDRPRPDRRERLRDAPARGAQGARVARACASSSTRSPAGRGGMRANRAYRLIHTRGSRAPAFLAGPDRMDQVEVVSIDDGEIVLFWDVAGAEAGGFVRADPRRPQPARGRYVPRAMVSGGGSMNVEAGGAQVRGLKPALEAQVPALAASLDGLTFTYISPVTAPQAAGGYVTVETPDGPRLGQIRQAVVEQADGPGDRRGGRRLRQRPDADPVRSPDRHRDDARALAVVPRRRPLPPRPAEAIGRWQESSRGRGAMLRLGEAAMAPGVLAELNAAGFGRHSFLCGQSGSGKSYAMGVILEQLLLETDIPIVVLDPNSDATRLQELADGADPALAERWRDIAPRIRVRGADREGDDRLRLRFFELEPALQQAVAGLDPLRDREEFDAPAARPRRGGGGAVDGADHRDAARRGRRPGSSRRSRCGSATWASWSGRAWARDFGDSGLLGRARRRRLALPRGRPRVDRAARRALDGRGRGALEAVGAARAAQAGAAGDRRGAQRLPARLPPTS